MSLPRFSQRLYSRARTFCASPFQTLKTRTVLVTGTIGVCTLCGISLTSKYTYDQYGLKNRKPMILMAKDIYSAEAEKGADESEEESGPPDVYQHARERRFYEFASVEVEGERYMTPQDFLESVTDEEPRARVGLRKISRDDLNALLKKTPRRGRGSSSLFRKIYQDGVISYSEYLFLLCILTKPKAGFKIAFKMFDTDGNERVDKQEFLVLEEIFRNKTEKSKVVRESNDPSTIHVDMEKERSKSDSFSLSELKAIISSKHTSIQDTSLLVYFFGQKGDKTLSFEDFYQFMDDLQTEVLELEFLAYSHGMPTISEDDFARVVMRYTDILDEDEIYTKLRDRIPEEKGLNFEEFRSFFQFLNNLEDFAVSINMYAISGKAIGEDEFHRAVKVTTGQDLSKNLVHTLYQLFDKDGDGKLSYVEFIGVMKDRLHRGFRNKDKKGSHVMKHVGWNGFKKCMKTNIKLAAKS